MDPTSSLQTAIACHPKYIYIYTPILTHHLTISSTIHNLHLPSFPQPNSPHSTSRVSQNPIRTNCKTNYLPTSLNQTSQYPIPKSLLSQTSQILHISPCFPVLGGPLQHSIPTPKPNLPVCTTPHPRGYHMSLSHLHVHIHVHTHTIKFPPPPKGPRGLPQGP